MRNIRPELFRYLDLKRHLWNTYFVGTINDPTECEPLDSFEVIDRRLFYVLVCKPLGIQYDPIAGAQQVDRIVVHPRANISDILLTIAKPQRGYWNEQKRFGAKGLSLIYMDFFQWNFYDFLTLPLVRGRIVQFSQHPEHIGIEALVDHHLVDFWLSP